MKILFGFITIYLYKFIPNKVTIFYLIFLFFLICSFKVQYNDSAILNIIQSFILLPIKPLKTYTDLDNIEFLKNDLGNLGGIYGIVHKESSKQYIGSSLNLYSRLIEHIRGRVA